MSKENMVKIFNSIHYKYDLYSVFSDFLELAAISISNSVMFSEKREKRYMEVIKKYEKREAEIFPKLLSELVEALTTNPTDVLGEVFMELELGSSWKGQFFTPYNLCLCTSQLIFSKEPIEKNGFIELNEPCSGGTAMVIAFAEVMKRNGYNPQKQLKVICQDLDIRCVYMSYIQLSLLGIPATICHMNTLSLEYYDSFKTPMWILGFWENKKPRKKVKEIKLTEQPDGQFSFI